MKRKAIFLLTTVCVFLSSVTQTGALAQTMRKSGDKIGQIGHYLHSDIVTYIDGHPIKSYNIDGYTAVIAEDLAKYGFRVEWDAKERTLTLQRDFWATPNPAYKIEQSPKNKNGSIAGDIFYTDIKCYHWWGLLQKEIRGFNIGGSTAIYVDDLAKVYGDTYVYDDADRTLRLGLVKGWDENFIDEITSSDFLYVIERFDLEGCVVIYAANRGVMHGRHFLWIVPYRYSGWREMLQHLPQDLEGWRNDFKIRDLKLSDNKTAITFTRNYEDEDHYYSVDIESAKLTEINKP